jgi:hypothetical protein
VQSARAETRVIRMVVGEQRQMSYSNMAKVTVGNPQVADVKTIGSNYRIPSFCSPPVPAGPP